MAAIEKKIIAKASGVIQIVSLGSPQLVLVDNHLLNHHECFHGCYLGHCLEFAQILFKGRVRLSF